MKEEIHKLIEKFEHAFEVAEKLLQDEYPADAASKVYFCFLYAAQALLKSEGIEVTKHSAVESAFGFHFAKTGKIDPSFHKMLLNSRKIREISDYGIDEDVSLEQASLKLNEAKLFLSQIKKILGIS